MWPGLADNDEASPTRVRDNQGFWERVRKSKGARERWNEVCSGGQKVEREGR